MTTVLLIGVAWIERLAPQANYLPDLGVFAHVHGEAHSPGEWPASSTY